MSRPVTTRFAPSPTGFLHIGGARTALFNWLHARHCKGRFLLRIEDTDRARSTPEAVAAILEGLEWLGLDWDGEFVSQADRVELHRKAAHLLLENGKAYRCYTTAEELAALRREATDQHKPFRFRSPWRDRAPDDTPSDQPCAVRLKVSNEGETVIEDLVQGRVSWQNKDLDDLVLLRSDGTPTYMLAVVVDDLDMEVSHVIRGDDHLTNAARQAQIYDALKKPRPDFAHLPLIHGPDGKKYSKRHGAIGLDAFAADGYLPEAMRNYLVRLGWAHGDDEVFSTAQAIDWFTLDAVGRSAARMDPDKLRNLNAVHLRLMPENEVLAALDQWLHAHQGRTLTPAASDRLLPALPVLLPRARTLKELVAMAEFLLCDSTPEPDDAARKQLSPENRAMLTALTVELRAASLWSPTTLETTLQAFAKSRSLGLGRVAQPLRAALTGTTVSPGIFDVMALLGRQESLARLQHWTQSENAGTDGDAT